MYHSMRIFVPQHENLCVKLLSSAMQCITLVLVGTIQFLKGNRKSENIHFLPSFKIAL